MDERKHGASERNKANGDKTEWKKGASGEGAAIAAWFSGVAAPSPRFLVAVNFALKAACRGNPPDLLRYGSSSQKVLRYFLGALFFVFGLFAR